ncbi:MAG TPA: hypothetical protein VD930_06890 [Gemmatimonadales bacterium]|nr:hypothetical protein [Gemmatimonadales bacterium]
MPKFLVLISVAAAAACSASPTAPLPESSPDAAGFDLAGRCFAVHTTGKVAADFRLPRLIELTQQPAPSFVDPEGRFAVREPAASEPGAPLSWWRPGESGSLELVLSGGFTAYQFSLTRLGAAWVGYGEYCSDMGLEPTPEKLPLRLTAASCS